jgi:uncharacterized membrane protein
MANKHQETVLCQICKRHKKPNEVLSAEMIHEPLVEMIRKTHPDWTPGGFICIPDLNRFRADYVEDVLEAEKGELSSLEDEVVKSLREQELLSRNINVEFDRQLSFGERLADRIATFGGSWSFLILFFSILLVWVVTNSVILLRRPFDPYPFILLNLVLSCLAAVQAPVILMSQNRQEDRDRLRAEHDYRVNLKAELEIRLLHTKMDQLLTHQWRRLLEIQRIQTELIDELVRRSERKHDV